MQQRPAWLKVKAPSGKGPEKITKMLKTLGLHTVCQSANCPNMGECWQGQAATATFMLLGNVCTRACKFCAVKTGNPHGVVDQQEPERLAAAINQLALRYVVLTSVDRDDLDDEGAGHFAATIRALKEKNPRLIIEALTPDFSSRPELLTQLITAKVDVFAHNIETTRRLTPLLRDRRASYAKSLLTLQRIKEINPQQYTKTSLMLGCGEEEAEVLATLDDLINVQCDIITFGQYISPSKRHYPVAEYITPQRFDYYAQQARQRGFLYVASGPLVRSSYRAGELFLSRVIKNATATRNY